MNMLYDVKAVQDEGENVILGIDSMKTLVSKNDL